MLLNGINRIKKEVLSSLADENKLNLLMFESYNDSTFKLPIIKNDFNKIKTYFRKLRSEYNFTEYIYSLNIILGQIETINDELFNKNLIEQYEATLWKVERLENYELINDYLINFIIRYCDLCVKYHFNEFVEYQKKLGLEILKLQFPKPKKRLGILLRSLDIINNEITFGRSRNINIPPFDYNEYSKRIFLLTLLEKKEIFESEIILIQKELKDKLNTQIEQLNPYPLIFINENVYNCFMDYQKYIIEFYTDYSYLKKQLEYLKLIHKQTDNDFMKFLLNDLKFITQKNYDDYCYKYESKLKSLSKSRSDPRLNNFNIVFSQFL
jgi:hypothetical protein